jgi:plastocyanin
MRRAALLATVMLLAPLVASISGATSARGSGAITIRGFAYRPPTLIVGQGEFVTWTNRDPVPHTATSDAVGFFDTGTLSVDSGSVGQTEFVSAGGFPFHCEFHASMHGRVQVPLELSPTGPVTPGTSIALRLASEKVAGRSYDVQRRRERGEWIPFQVDVMSMTIGVQLKKTGRYSFRARVTNDMGGTSLWSPKARIKVVAA